MPWDWDWTVMLDGVEVAQGDVEIDHPDGAEWDHQEFEKAQARCLAVANGILLQRVREVWRDESLSAWRHIGPHSYWTIHSPDCTGPDGLDSQQTETEVLVATLEAAP